MSLKVFAIQAYGPYCCGQAIVAAKDAAQAVEIASKIETHFNVRYHSPATVTELPLSPYKGKGPMVIIHFETGE